MTGFSVNSLDDLQDLALELGATIKSESGEVFNAGGRKGVQRQRKPNTPTPAPDPTKELLESLVQAVSRPVEVKLPPAEIRAVPQPVSWVFDFDRNEDGTIKRIRAKPEGTA